MATDRPFDYGKRDYLDKLNALYDIGMPRMLVDPMDPESEPTDIIVDRNLVYEDNGLVGDVKAAVNFTFDAGTMQDGWSCFINSVSGTATINVGSASAQFQDGTTSKTVTAGNAALISFDGTDFRIFRFSAT